MLASYPAVPSFFLLAGRKSKRNEKVRTAGYKAIHMCFKSCKVMYMYLQYFHNNSLISKLHSASIVEKIAISWGGGHRKCGQFAIFLESVLELDYCRKAD